MIDPPSTAWFDYYASDAETIIPVFHSNIYNNDLIGLKHLYVQHKLKFVSLPGDHLEFSYQDI